MYSYNHFGCSWSGSPFNGGNCQGCSSVGSKNEFVYDLNPYSYNEIPNFFNQPPQHQYETYSCELCGDSPHYGFDCQIRTPIVYEHGPCSNQNFSNDQSPYYSPSQPQQLDCCEVCGGPHFSSNCQIRNPLVYEPNPSNNYDFPSSDQPPKYHIDNSQQFDGCEHYGGPYYASDCQTGNVFYEHAPYDNHDSFRFDQPSQPLTLSELKRREMITFMIESQIQFDKTQKKLNIEFQNELNRLQEMMSLRNSNQDPPVNLYDLKGSDKGDNKIDSVTMELYDTFLMGDKSDVTSVYDDLECDMPITIPLPTTDVKEENFDINSPIGEYVVDFLMENEDVAGLPRHLVKQLFSNLLKNPSLTKGMSDEPLSDDSKPRSYDVTFSNPLFEFNDDFTLCNDNLLFDEEFEDISSLDPMSRLLLLMSLPCLSHHFPILSRFA
ncbi:hypothetical protein Tco_1441355 [Tanacetum coccineum]